MFYGLASKEIFELLNKDIPVFIDCLNIKDGERILEIDANHKLYVQKIPVFTSFNTKANILSFIKNDLNILEGKLLLTESSFFNNFTSLIEKDALIPVQVEYVNNFDLPMAYRCRLVRDLSLKEWEEMLTGVFEKCNTNYNFVKGKLTCKDGGPSIWNDYIKVWTKQVEFYDKNNPLLSDHPEFLNKVEIWNVVEKIELFGKYIIHCGGIKRQEICKASKRAWNYEGIRCQFYLPSWITLTPERLAFLDEWPCFLHSDGEIISSAITTHMFSLSDRNLYPFSVNLCSILLDPNNSISELAINHIGNIICPNKIKGYKLCKRGFRSLYGSQTLNFLHRYQMLNKVFQ